MYKAVYGELTEVLYRICLAGPLVSVEYWVNLDPDCGEKPVVDTIVLGFERGPFTFFSDEDTEHVVVFDGRPNWREQARIVPVTAQAPWKGLVGYEVADSWVLFSDIGYVDSVQIDFRKPGEDKDERTQIELEGPFGDFAVRVLNPVVYKFEGDRVVQSNWNPEKVRSKN